MIVGTAGIAFVYNDSILLVHSTGGNWKNLSIPKGHIEDGESVQAAAIRETFEETGIQIDQSKLEKNAFFLDYPNKKKRVYYYILRINDLSEIGLSELVVPKQQLELSEIDWAKFVSFDEARNVMYKPQQAILNRIQQQVSEMLNFQQFLTKG